MLQRQSAGTAIPTPRRTGIRAALLTWLALLALTLTGCGSSGDSSSSAGSAAAAKAPATDRIEPLPGSPASRLPATVRSADGHDVTVRSTDRIVPLTGALSEIVFTLGLGDRVVARDVTATFEQAAKLPVVTRAHDVSAESVLSLKPTLVLAETTTGPAEAVEQIRAAGVPLVVLDPARSLADVAPRIGKVAAALGVPAAGEELNRRTQQRLKKAEEGVPHGGGKKPRVAFLYLRGTASVYLLGGAGSGADSLIEAAGGVDAGKESGLKKDFTPLTSEALAKAAPDVILVMSKGLDSVGGVDGLVKIPGVGQTPAGLDRRVASVDDGVLLNFGPRTDAVLASLVEQIHRGK
ncbi:heme/hemin ABC transporter substrate-binding protein [Streptomyces sp. URMC 127]|uniref:heme/hemin ABC transporter substrate-binding protein n=1 Tax=Streptomyces sp. URMC 127 TaxID=3423402 RepID=UPI003F1BE262